MRALELNEESFSASLAGTDSISLSYEKLKRAFEDENLSWNENIKKGKTFSDLESYYLLDLKKLSDFLAKIIYKAYLARAKYIFQEMPRHAALSELGDLFTVYSPGKNRTGPVLPFDLPLGFYTPNDEGKTPQHIAERLTTLAQSYADFLHREESRLFGRESELPSSARRTPDSSFREVPVKLEYLAKLLRNSTVDFSKFSSNQGWENLHTVLSRAPIIYETYEKVEVLESTLQDLLKDYREVSLGGEADRENLEQAREKVVEFFSASNTDLSLLLHVLTDRTPFSNQELPLRRDLSLMQDACLYYKTCKQLLEAETKQESDTGSNRALLELLEENSLYLLNKTFYSSGATEALGDVSLLSKEDYLVRFIDTFWRPLTEPLEEPWGIERPLAESLGDTCKLINKFSEALLEDTEKIRYRLFDKEIVDLIKERYN